MASITVINNPTNTQHDITVHATGCRDIKRETASPFADSWAVDWAGSAAEFTADYNIDYDEETEGHWPIHYHACALKALRAA